MQCATQAREEIHNRAGCGGQHRLHHQLALGIEHRHADGVLVDIQPDIIDAIHQGVPFVLLQFLLLTATADYRERGALL